MHEEATPKVLSTLSTPEIRALKRQAEIRRLILRRLPLIIYESFLGRLAGLHRNHQASAKVAATLLRRAAGIRLTRDLELARELEEEYLAHLATQGLEETWYDSRTNEAALLDQHHQAVARAVDCKCRVAPTRLRQSEER